MGEKREALAMVITCPQWSSAGALLWLSLCGAISRLLPLKCHFERAKALSTGGQIFQTGFTIMSKTAPCFPFFPGSGLSEVMDEMARFFRLIIDEWKYQRKFGQETSVLYIYYKYIYIYLNKNLYTHKYKYKYIYIYTYVRTYIHTFIHTYICRENSTASRVHHVARETRNFNERPWRHRSVRAQYFIPSFWLKKSQ